MSSYFASTTTAIPVGCIASSMACAICFVNRSCAEKKIKKYTVMKRMFWHSAKILHFFASWVRKQLTYFGAVDCRFRQSEQFYSVPGRTYLGHKPPTPFQWTAPNDADTSKTSASISQNTTENTAEPLILMSLRELFSINHLNRD